MATFVATAVGSGKGGSGKGSANTGPSASSGPVTVSSSKPASSSSSGGGGGSVSTPTQPSTTATVNSTTPDSQLSAQGRNIQATQQAAAQRSQVVRQLENAGFTPGVRAEMAASAIINGTTVPAQTQAERNAVNTYSNIQRQKAQDAQAQASQAQFEENVQKVSLKFGVPESEAARLVREQVPEGNIVNYSSSELRQAQAQRNQIQTATQTVLPQAGRKAPNIDTLRSQATPLQGSTSVAAILDRVAFGANATPSLLGKTTVPQENIPYLNALSPDSFNRALGIRGQGQVTATSLQPQPYASILYEAGTSVPYRQVPIAPVPLGGGKSLIASGSVEGYGQVQIIQEGQRKLVLNEKGKPITALQNFLDAGGNLQLVKTPDGSTSLGLSGNAQGYQQIFKADGTIAYGPAPKNEVPSSGIAGKVFAAGTKLVESADQKAPRTVNVLGKEFQTTTSGDQLFLGKVLQGTGLFLSNPKELAVASAEAVAIGGGLTLLSAVPVVGAPAATAIGSTLLGFGAGSVAAKTVLAPSGQRIQTFTKETELFGTSAIIAGATLGAGNKAIETGKRAVDLARGETVKANLDFTTSVGATGEVEANLQGKSFKGIFVSDEPGTLKTDTTRPAQSEIVLSSSKSSIQISQKGMDQINTLFEGGKRSVTSTKAQAPIELFPEGSATKTTEVSNGLLKETISQPLTGQRTTLNLFTKETTLVKGTTEVINTRELTAQEQFGQIFPKTPTVETLNPLQKGEVPTTFGAQLFSQKTTLNVESTRSLRSFKELFDSGLAKSLRTPGTPVLPFQNIFLIPQAEAAGTGGFGFDVFTAGFGESESIPITRFEPETTREIGVPSIQLPNLFDLTAPSRSVTKGVAVFQPGQAGRTTVQQSLQNTPFSVFGPNVPTNLLTTPTPQTTPRTQPRSKPSSKPSVGSGSTSGFTSLFTAGPTTAVSNDIASPDLPALPDVFPPELATPFEFPGFLQRAPGINRGPNFDLPFLNLRFGDGGAGGVNAKGSEFINELQAGLNLLTGKKQTKSKKRRKK